MWFGTKHENHGWSHHIHMRAAAFDEWGFTRQPRSFDESQSSNNTPTRSRTTSSKQHRGRTVDATRHKILKYILINITTGPTATICCQHQREMGLEVYGQLCHRQRWEHAASATSCGSSSQFSMPTTLRSPSQGVRLCPVRT